jgi:hypothetical protein
VIFSATSNENGEFLMGSIRPGKYSIRISASGFESIETAVEITRKAAKSGSRFIKVGLAVADYSSSDPCESRIGVSSLHK